MALARSLLCGLLVAAHGPPAVAQKRTVPAAKFSGFLCEIDLQENGLNTPSRVAPPVQGGSVFTLDSSKLCTGSAPGENIKLDCTARIPGWKGGTVDIKDPPCTIAGAACGLPGFLTATNNRLKIDAAGNATLSCQYKG
jgi:hypothetical protein